MKTVTANPAYKVYCLRIVPNWGSPIHITNHVRDLKMGANTYKSDYGYRFSGQASESNMSPGVMDLEGVANIAGISRDQIVSGVFDNARVYCFATTWVVPTEDEEPIGLALMGKIKMEDDRYTAELMHIVDALNQTVGDTYMPSCPKTFGGQGFAGCKVSLAPITKTGTLTSVTSNSAFTDSARTEPADWFGEGTIAFTSGANAGLKPQMIRWFSAGDIVTHEPFHYPVSVGDAYIIIPGCRKRLVDCRDKWGNVPNFGGYSFIPASSVYTQQGNRR